ncbi:MAG: hypothetical protein M3R27_05665 [Bacteroidota bacterium]|nr:hypothetical protein [Bacteroidota bacterium]
MKPEIHIFKTNITSVRQIKTMDTILSGHSGISKWNLDIEDCDKVLRIESKISASEVIDVLEPHLIYCEAMV